jgi:ribosomal peptide maturation radical SAM protein 1
VSLDAVPTPDYDEYFDELRAVPDHASLAGDIRIPFESARGCWYGAKHHCTFCGLNADAMTFRSKPPDLVLHDVVALSERYRHTRFAAVDNIIDTKYLDTLVPALQRSGYDLSVFYEIKGNIRKPAVRRLKAAGIDAIQPGLESLSTPILRLIDKGITAFQNVQLLKWCAIYDLDVSWNILYGIPGEPPDEYQRMAALVPALTQFAPPSFVALDLHRYSPYHTRPDRHGLEIIGPAEWYRHVYDACDEELRQLAYSFEYRYADGRDPASYTGELSEAVDRWRDGIGRTYQALRVRVGPGFSTVSDRRGRDGEATFVLGETESFIYALCADGCHLTRVQRELAERDDAIGDGDLDDFVSDLESAGLLFREGDQCLALALPMPAAAERESRDLDGDTPVAARSWTATLVS